MSTKAEDIFRVHFGRMMYIAPNKDLDIFYSSLFLIRGTLDKLCGIEYAHDDWILAVTNKRHSPPPIDLNSEAAAKTKT